MSDTTLLGQTLALLRNRPATLSLAQIARDTELNYEWLKKLSYGHIPDPGVTKVERLHGYLARAASDAAA